MIITVASFKGGVGKTTTVLHLAAFFAERNKTILVDSDLNHGASRWGKRGLASFEIYDEKNVGEAGEFTHRIIDTAARPADEGRPSAGGDAPKVSAGDDRHQSTEPVATAAQRNGSVERSVESRHHDSAEISKEILNEERLIGEAIAQGLTLTATELAQLQPLAGRNPMLARKVVKNHRLGLTQKAKPQHTQYVVIMPILIAALMAFGVVRFVGMGTQNKSLYIMGGVCLVSGMALKQLGGIRGARKRLGQ